MLPTWRSRRSTTSSTSRYWYDEATGKVFCLAEAPSPEAAEAVHREAHGLLADSIVEVKEGA